MKLTWIIAFVLLVASLAALFSSQQTGRLIADTLAASANVLPNSKLDELERATHAYAGRLFNLMPEPFRQKFEAKTWRTVELITFRSLVLWHLIPSFAIALMIGFLEGSWARANQKGLIKMHSPMRFSLSVTSLGLTPILALLWIAAPVAISAVLLVLAVGTLAIFSTRNLIVHSPTQF
ncbi:MAG: DUF4400 domain-containing protein [Terriglobales bacterium]